MLALGGLVEEQIENAITVLVNGDTELTETVISRDYQALSR